MNCPIEQHTAFCILQKHIETAADLEAFKQSSAYRELIEFTVQLSISVKAAPNETHNVLECSISETCKCLYTLLEEIESSVTLFPPEEGSHRFGNPAFRGFHNHISREATEWLTRHVLQPYIQLNFLSNGNLPEPTSTALQARNDNPKLQHEAVPSSNEADTCETIIRSPLVPSMCIEAANEVSGYLQASFGDRSRIDYGSGHELNFLCFLLCLFKLRIFEHSDFADIVRVVFKKYLTVCRILQSKYKLEPAGSRGVWGIDDFQFLPFLFGSSQLIGNTTGILPSQAVNERHVLQHGDEYLYLDAIRRIYEIKSGVPFGESSPLLNDISAIPTWARIHNGMLKMYQAEVLGKLPVMQHFLFGSLIPFPLPAGDSQPATTVEITTSQES